MSEEVFKKFLVFLASNLDENKDLLMLVQKRYDECNDKFRISLDFQSLVEDVQSRITEEKHRIFVHLKDFLTKLKSFQLDSNDRKRKQGGFGNDHAKRLCAGNSCSDASSDSDFFKKVNKKNQTKKGLKNDLSSTKSINPKDIIDTVNLPSSSSSSAVKKLDENSKTTMGKSRDEPWPVSEEESLSLDSVRSDTKSSDCSDDVPLYLNTTFAQEPESISVDSVSSESKSSHIVPSPNTANEVCLNTTTSLPNHSKSSNKNATDELPESHDDRVAEPETHVVIDDISCSDLSLPCLSPVPCANKIENAETLQKSDSIEKDDSESMKKKKGSERQIKRLEKLLGDIHNEIENTTKNELSLDELGKEDSSYVYEDRLQKKFVKVWEKLCELKGQDTSTGRPIEKRFHFQGTRYAEINKRIEKFINKKKIFPDYNDIKKIVTQVNTHYNLYLGKPAIEDLAREAFTDVGNQLQERRHKNFILTFGNSQTEVNSITQDPALYNPELRKKLQNNRKLAKTKLDEIISKYAKMQYETNAQPEEVDDNALESSSEEEEEEEEETQDIPELDEVMALSDDDDVSEIPENSSLNSGMLLTKNLKVQIEKLKVPAAMLVKKKTSLPSSTTSSCSSTVATSQNINQDTKVAISNTGLKPLPSHTVVDKQNPSRAHLMKSDRQNSKKAASNEIVIDLDSSSDADDSAEVVSAVQPSRQQALVPIRTWVPTNLVNSSNRVMNPAHSSSSSTMIMSSQNNMQFSMQVKTQFQQQKQDGFSLKIASVTSLAYAIKDNNRNTQYFTSKQTNFQNQGLQLTSSKSYKQISKRPVLPAPSNSVIVLSDSE